MLKFTVQEENTGVRLDVFLSVVSDITRSNAQKLIEEECVFVNGKVETKKYKMK